MSNWAGGKVKCDICTHEWLAVYNADCDQLECPNCENMASYEEVESELN